MEIVPVRISARKPPPVAIGLLHSWNLNCIIMKSNCQWSFFRSAVYWSWCQTETGRLEAAAIMSKTPSVACDLLGWTKIMLTLMLNDNILFTYRNYMYWWTPHKFRAIAFQLKKFGKYYSARATLCRTGCGHPRWAWSRPHVDCLEEVERACGLAQQRSMILFLRWIFM